MPWDLFFLGWNYEVAHPDANRKMHYVIEKSNKILGEEKEKTEGVRTAYIQLIQNIQNILLKVR